MNYRIVKINVTQDPICCRVVTGTRRIYSVTMPKDGGVIAYLHGGRVTKFPVVKQEFRLPRFAEETLRKAESSGIGFYKANKEAGDTQYVRDEMVDMILGVHGLEKQPELAEDIDLLKELCRIDARFSLGAEWNDRASSDWQAMEEYSVKSGETNSLLSMTIWKGSVSGSTPPGSCRSLISHVSSTLNTRRFARYARIFLRYTIGNLIRPMSDTVIRQRRQGWS